MLAPTAAAMPLGHNYNLRGLELVKGCACLDCLPSAEACALQLHGLGREFPTVPDADLQPGILYYIVKCGDWVKFAFPRSEEQANSIYEAGMRFLRCHRLLTKLSQRPSGLQPIA